MFGETTERQWEGLLLGSSTRSSDEFGTKVGTNVHSFRLTRLAAKYWEYPEQPESRSRGQTVPKYFFFFFFFFGWGKGGKCFMHPSASWALCVGLQYGLPVDLLARWTKLPPDLPTKTLPRR